MGFSLSEVLPEREGYHMRTSIKMILIALIIFAAPAHGFLGVGDITFDPSTWAAAMSTYYQQLTAVKNQLQQLQNEAANLASMDAGTQQSTISAIQSKLQQLSAINNGVRGLTMDYARVERQFDQVYPDFSKYNGMSGEDYAALAEQQQSQTHNAMADAMKAQGLVANGKTDQDNLTALMQASQNSQGALAAAQAGNQIAGMQVQQLLQLQQIMATSARAQTSYQAQQVADSEASAAKNKSLMKDWGKTNPDRPKIPINPF